MRFTTSVLLGAAAGFALGLSIATTVLASPALQSLADIVTQVEDRLDGRVGIALVDTGSDLTWTHRPDEGFLMNSTVKVPICGAVLARRDAGTMSLSEELPIRDADLLSYAPVTEERVGENMTLEDLCFAALDMSDNTATNLLIDHLGGPEAVTQFFRSIGDPVSRLDRREPELNAFAVGDPRDTTTPVAMAATLRDLLLGTALAPASRGQLAEWMSHGAVTGTLLRQDAPADWVFSDKSGSGSHTRNIVAVVIPEGRAPWIVTIFISDADEDFATRNAALQELSAAVMAVIRE